MMQIDEMSNKKFKKIVCHDLVLEAKKNLLVTIRVYEQALEPFPSHPTRFPLGVRTGLSFCACVSADLIPTSSSSDSILKGM